MTDLLKEYNEMRRLPMVEIVLDEYTNAKNEYSIYSYHADEKGMYAGYITNVGFKAIDGLFVEWGDVFSLDEHLQGLYNLCVEHAINDYNNNKEI